MLSDNYLLIDKIGSGSFGDVYLAKNTDTLTYVAAKVEQKKHAPRLYNEYKIYYYLDKHGFKTGLPTIYEFIETSDHNIMFMQLLGKNLEDLFNKCKRKFTQNTVLKLGKRIIELIEQMHNAGFVHRDIKPNNFLIDPKTNEVYITDFGLSKKIISKSGHIKYKDNRSLVGTARYASINVHMGIEPTRRDDLESIGYMLIYFLRGSLPWQSIKKQNTTQTDHLEKIGEVKICTSMADLCAGIHPCFAQYLQYCKNLKFDETPDYARLKALFVDNNKAKYDWIY